MGLLDSILSAVDSKKRSLKRGVMDMVDNPSQWADMQAARVQEDRYGGAENAQAMKQYLSKKPYDKVAKGKAEDALRNAAVNESLGAITVWHGSPHKFDKFDMSKIGTGEGAQAYGHGLYMAEAPKVATEYQKRLSDAGSDYTFQWNGNQYPAKSGPEAHAISLAFHDSPKTAKSIGKEGLLAAKNGEAWANEMGGVDYWKKMLDTASQIRSKKEITGVQGALYKVDIPDEAVARFLDWDKPLSQQAPEVQKAFLKAHSGDDPLLSELLDMSPAGLQTMGMVPSAKGAAGYKTMAETFGNDVAASQALKNAGIPGIRYLDNGSRDLGAGTSNFVLFDDQMPRILEVNGQATGLNPWGKGEWKGLLDDAPQRPLTEFEQRHLTAQKNAALPVEQGGLGLPADNTAMDRARAMGAVDAYHGTASDVQQLDPRMFGSSTGAESAKRAWWAVDDPSTARGYAEYAATQAPVKRLLNEADRLEKKGDWDGYDNVLGQAEALEAKFADSPLNGQNIMPLKIIPNNPRVMDAAGAEFTDVEGGVNNFLRQAKFGKNDAAIIKNLSDDVGFNGRPATHYGILDPSVVRSRFAAFDPMRRHEADLLGNATPEFMSLLAGGGLLGLGGYSLMGDQ